MGEKEDEEAVVVQVEGVKKVKDDKPTRNGSYLPFLAASFFRKHKQPTLLLNPITYIANVG